MRYRSSVSQHFAHRPVSHPKLYRCRPQKTSCLMVDRTEAGSEALCGGSSLFSRLIILPTSSLQSSLFRSVQEPNDYDFWRMICRMRVRTGGTCVVGAACRSILHIDRCLTRSCTGADSLTLVAPLMNEREGPLRTQCFRRGAWSQALNPKAKTL